MKGCRNNRFAQNVETAYQKMFNRWWLKYTQTMAQSKLVTSANRPSTDNVDGSSLGRHDGQRNDTTRLRWPVAIFLLAAILRLAAATGDLAIDEIWTLWFVKFATQRFIDLFSIRHDNNHLLNTMIVYGLGSNLPEFYYRLPAAIASILAVWLAGRIAMRRGGFPASVAAWIFVGMSYLLILYGCEARGYSYAICFAYLSWLCLLRIDERRRRADAILFALSSCLGFLAHLTFLYCYAGFCVWTVWKWVRKPSWILVLAHAPPLVVASGLYLYFIRGIAIGGGPETTIASAVISTASIVGGGPLYDDGALIAAVLVLIMLGIGLVRVWRTDQAMAACFTTIIILAPASVLLLTGHQLIYPRYFLVPVAFALLLMSDTVASMWSIRGGGRICAAIMIVAYLAGNFWWTALLIDHGRGDYSRALTWMASQSTEGPATISTDHDFRNRIVFDFYSSRLWPDQAPLSYVDQHNVSPHGTDWLIRHNFDGDPPFPNVITDVIGVPYRLEQTFRHQSLTGWNWWVYRRIKTQ